MQILLANAKIMNNRITDPEEMKAFCYEGFKYNPHLGEGLYPHFVKEL